MQGNKIDDSLKISMYFIQHVTNIFKATKKLESVKTTILNLYEILSNFIVQLVD